MVINDLGHCNENHFTRYHIGPEGYVVYMRPYRVHWRTRGDSWYIGPEGIVGTLDLRG